MSDVFDILIYVIPLAIWLFAQVQQSKKEQRRKGTTLSVPQPEIMPTVEPEQQPTLREEVVVQSEERFSEKRIESQKLAEKRLRYRETRRKPYKEGVAYKAKIKKTTEKQKGITVERESGVEISEIDWTKAVIYSEILRPRF